MPLFIHKNIRPQGELGIWEIEEPEAYFLQQLKLSEKESTYFAQLKGKRGIEWLASRLLLHQMSGRAVRGNLIKDEYGKPFLENSSFHISLSHSHEMAAVIASPLIVGIDIQRLVAKIERIAHKYMRDAEMESLEAASRLAHLHVYWGAKEALYKAYGRKELDFKKHIFIEPFNYDLANGKCSGKIKKGNFEAKYDVYYERINDYILVYSILNRNQTTINRIHK